jgi:xylulokinase
MSWLAFDIGTTGTKAALIAADGRALRSAYRDYETFTADGGVVEQNAEDWWMAARDAVRGLTGSDSEDIEGIALTGQMQDVILVDAEGMAVRPAILYSDSRAYVEAAELNATMGANQLRALTGNDQGAGSLLAKLRWLTVHEPESLTRSR